MKHSELNTETLNKDLIFKIREAGRYLHPRPADKNRQKEILVFLNENGTIPQRELTRKLKITPPSVSELLRKLEYTELIRRVPNERDRRNMNVELTDLGSAVANEYAKNSEAYEKELFSVLSNDEKLEFDELLDKLLAYWETILEPEPPRPGHRPPHERGPKRHPHHPPHKPDREPVGPLDELEHPHHRPPEEHIPLELEVIEGEGPETWGSFLEILDSAIKTMTGGKGSLLSRNDDFDEPLSSDESPISPTECPVELEEDTPPIPPEDGELPTETDIDVKTTTEDEL